MEEMHGEYKVYVHVNKINGKIYIGQTKQTLEQRYKNGYEHCRHFWNAIQKYGWDNFEHIILVDNLSIDMANIIEEELIKKYNTTNHNNGYNMKSGGLNHIPSEETRKLMSEAHSGERHWNYGKHWGDDFKKKLSEIHTGREMTDEWKQKISNKNKGKRHTNETKEKMRESKVGIKNPMYGKHISEKTIQLRRENCKHILQYDLNGVFIKEWTSSVDISKEYNVDISNIIRCCLGETKSCVNYMWKYKNEDNIQQRITSYNQLTEEQIISSRYKSVFQYDINGNFLRSFDSALHVETALGINSKQIRECCRGQLKIVGGYRWSYQKVDKLPKLKTTEIFQFDKEWNYIRMWASATAIEREINIDKSSIIRCCKGKQSTAGGYKWKYKEDCLA